MSKVIVFYVPSKHKPKVKYVPEAQRGKILTLKETVKSVGVK